MAITPPTFTYGPNEAPTGTTTYRILKAQFGDGYMQASADGINNTYDTWSLVFAGGAADVSPVKVFLDALQGYLPFYWTAPLGTLQLYRVDMSSPPTLVPTANDNYTYAVTFIQAFHP
jgi:phage-related protein